MSMNPNASEKLERNRVSDILALGQRRGQMDAAQRFIAEGRGVDEFQAFCLDKIPAPFALNTVDTGPALANRSLSSPMVRSQNIGLTQNERSNYRLTRLIRALAYPSERRYQDEAAFEFECAAAASRGALRAPKGTLVPGDVLGAGYAQRNLMATASTKGANSVATDLLGGSFIDLLRNRLVLAQAGASVLADLQGNVAIPRQASSSTGYWVGEGDDVTESDFTIDQITLSPKTVGGFVTISKQLIVQSSLDAEALVRDDISKILALELDRAGLYGDPAGSSHQPTGITKTSGILKATAGLTAFAATTPTFAELVAMETAVGANNADLGTPSYVVSPTMRGALKTALKFSLALTGTDTAGAIAVSGAQGPTIWEPGGRINDTNAVVSNQVSSGDVFYGSFDQLLLGLWGGLDLIVDPFTLAPSAQIRIVAHQIADWSCRNAKSLAFNHH